MNVFYVDHDPAVAARMLCDKHVVKMVLETTQILSTVMNKHGGKGPYKSTHKNHPCVKWAGKSWSNYAYLWKYMVYLCAEYTYRYGKAHKCSQFIDELHWIKLLNCLPNTSFTEPPQCMPDEYRQEDTVEAYRAYYRGEKARFAKWEKGREKPEWYLGG